MSMCFPCKYTKLWFCSRTLTLVVTPPPPCRYRVLSEGIGFACFAFMAHPPSPHCIGLQ
jgi:hypothetical protein